MKYLAILSTLAVLSLGHRVKELNDIHDKIDIRTEKLSKSKIVEAPEVKDIFEINKGVKSPILIHGDVVSHATTKNTVRDTSRQWPTTKVPFVYSPIVSLEAIGSIELARQEYRLRTCMDFVERTTESNYISFRTLNGCYSSVGMVGGAQTISIGSGCERMATVCHEMMHAIGIWHEQSRADRDDYVKIEWSNIESGYENNFNKYDWEITAARRVPYDYNSIMHYGDTSFSTNGDPTIVTRDDAFQDVIGQRLTFSRGDSTKINRMYNCSDTLLFSYNCNFEEESVCGYNQNNDVSSINWFRYVIGDKSVPAPATAPIIDATVDASDIGSYMLLDTSGKTIGDIGQLSSMRLRTKSDVQCLQFSYYLDRAVGSTAALSVSIGNIDQVTGDIISVSEPLATFDGDYEDHWNIQRMTIHATDAYRIVFDAKTGGYSDDVIALDDVSVQDKPCETGYFVVPDYKTILASAVPDETVIYSPTLYTDDGYAFRVKIYPAGTSSSASGYMGMYFGLMPGVNDDDLQWPFCNRYIRMMVVDQSNNPLYSLNKYAEYLTTQEAGGDLWNRPTDPDGSGTYGYRNFMKIDDLLNTHHYIKHDSVMFSVLVKDMNWVDNTVCSGNFTKKTQRPMHYKQTQVTTKDFDIDEDDDDDDDHIDHDHSHDHDSDNMISTGAAAGIAIGCSLFVLVVMSLVLYFVKDSYKAKLKIMANNVTLHSSTAVPVNPPSYSSAQNQAFTVLPEKI